jgi:hypothetical protein
MASYKFEIESRDGPVSAIVSGDGTLEIFDLDVEYEQATTEFYVNPSPAYALTLLWDRLIDTIAFRYAPRYDLMEKFAITLSRCPAIIEDKELMVFAFTDDQMELYNVRGAVARSLVRHIEDLEETEALALAEFAKAIGVHVDIGSYNQYTKQLDCFVTLLCETHSLELEEWRVGYSWRRYSKCEFTDIFYFNQKSVDATSEDDPDYNPAKHINPETMQFMNKVMDAIGIKDKDYIEDACYHADNPPRPCSIEVPGEYALLYYAVRPLKNSPYPTKYSAQIIEYPDLEEAKKAYMIATTLNDNSGHYYDIFLMKRRADPVSFGEKYENWGVMSKKRQQKIGSFQDWVAQFWEEV